jgi:AraC-like DNA-binding protein
MNPSFGEKISFARLPDLGVEVLSVDNSSRKWTYFHETYVVCTNLPETRGRGEWVYRRKRYEALLGQQIVVEPGETHVTDKMAGEASFRALILPSILIGRIAGEFGFPLPPHFALAQVGIPSLYRAFFNFHKVLESGEAGPLELESRLTVCVARLLANCAERRPAELKSPPPGALDKACQFLHAHPREEVSLDDLSQAAGLTRFHFLRSFVRRFGLPPHAYQLQLRVAEAKKLIAAGAPPCGADLGFSDQAHFIRHFKRIMGVTPGRYATMIGAHPA